MTLPRGPASLTQQTAERTDGSSDLRTGTVSAVTSRGISVAIAGGSVDASHLDSYAPAVGDTVALMKTQDSWLALGRVVGSGTPTDYTAPGSGIGVGILDAMKTSGTSTLASSTGTSQTVTKYNVTFWHPQNHIVVVWAFFTWSGTVSGDWIICDMTETVSGNAVGEFVQPLVNSSFGRADMMVGTLGQGFGGAKRAVQLTMSRLTGSGTINFTQNDARPGFMIALDMGDTSVFRVV